MMPRRVRCFQYALIAISTLSLCTTFAQADRFTYRQTKDQDYGPADWSQIKCDNPSTCEGFPNSWILGRGWSIGDQGNNCRNCHDNYCTQHNQGPVDTQRVKGIPNSTSEVECFDIHWMEYHDGACTWEDMTNNDNSEFRNNFFIRRHALQINQPLGTDGRLKCPNRRRGVGNYFPKMDYSRGFPDWWLMSHIEIKTPSEFTQDGKRYDGEIHLSHFYSQPYVEEAPFRKLGTIAIFFKAYENVSPDPFMDKIICQFRKTEDKVREDCGYASVRTPYPGCWNYRRKGQRPQKITITKRPGPGSRHLRRSSNISIPSEPHTTYPDPDNFNLVDENYEEPIDFDFDAFIEKEIRTGGGNGNWSETVAERHLKDYEHVPWHAYRFLTNVRTEYYHRLEATQTLPPCHTPVHWRVMKDPLRLHPRQVSEIERLLAQRIAPLGSQYKECQFDTAGAPRPGKLTAVDLNRPIQQFHPLHRMRFCECKDWPSKWPEDRAWCESGGYEKRFFDHPYNFMARDSVETYGTN